MTIGSTFAVIHGFTIVFRFTKSLCISMKLLISHTWFLVAGGRNGFPSFSWSQKCEQIGCPVQEDVRVEMYSSGWSRIIETANLFSDKPLPACA